MDNQVRRNMKIEFEMVEKDQLEAKHRSLFSEMLKRQGKVQGDLSEKADRCKCICIAKVDGAVAAVGAIKRKPLPISLMRKRRCQS
jgi:hypothetical protein